MSTRSENFVFLVNKQIHLEVVDCGSETQFQEAEKYNLLSQELHGVNMCYTWLHVDNEQRVILNLKSS